MNGTAITERCFLKSSMKPNKASATAHLIAASTVFLSKNPTLNFLAPPEWSEPCSWFVEEYSSFGKTLLKLIPKPWFRFLVKMVECFGVPGFVPHCVLRKHCLEDAVLEYLQRGFSQVIILGAGFDTLALRFHRKYEKVRFFEVDFPATQEVKRRALKKRNLPNNNMLFVPVDFTHEEWTEKLASDVGFNPELDTVFVAEGVLMYLTEAQVKMALSFMSDAKGANRVAIFTFMEMQPNGSISFRNSSQAVEWWLKIKGEVFQWGVKLAEIPSFLQSVGLRKMKIFNTDDFRQTYLQGRSLENITLAEGECVCVAEK